jgi:hypothetical protein
VIALAIAAGVLVLLAIAAFLHSLVQALLVQEVRGALAERLKRQTVRAAATLPPDMSATYAEEWLGELEAAKDRPLKAVLIVRGYKRAARGILAADPALAPSSAGPGSASRLQNTARNRGLAFYSGMQMLLRQVLADLDRSRGARMGFAAAVAPLPSSVMTLTGSDVNVPTFVGITVLSWIGVSWLAFRGP